MKRYLLGLGTLFFLTCAFVNCNDPDWIIWFPFYLSISLSPFLWPKSSGKVMLNLFAFAIFTCGLCVYLELLNPFMMIQTDDQMVGLFEHQREGIGIILSALWIKGGAELRRS